MHIDVSQQTGFRMSMLKSACTQAGHTKHSLHTVLHTHQTIQSPSELGAHCMQDQSRSRASSGPWGFLSSLFFSALTFVALTVLFGLGVAAIKRYSGGGAGAFAGGPSTAITGPGGTSYAPKEYNKVRFALV